jgi:hypothetical protein
MAVLAFPSAGLTDAGAYGRLLGLHVVANMDCYLDRQEPSLLHADPIEDRPKRLASSQSAKGGAWMQNALCITLPGSVAALRRRRDRVDAGG